MMITQNSAAVAALLTLGFVPTAFGQTPWTNFAKNAHHNASSTTAAQALNSIHWQTPVDLDPQYSGRRAAAHPDGAGELLIHYGTPLITAANTVIVPVKTQANGGFRVEAHTASNGTLVWKTPTDYLLPPSHGWTPVFGPALGAQRLYLPGAGGTVLYRDTPDSATGTEGRLVFYGSSNYGANPTGFRSSVYINTPLTVDESGNIFFGFLVSGSSPLSGLTSGIARIGRGGQGTWISVSTAAADATMTEVPYNCAPALSKDGLILYVAVSNTSNGYLVSLDSTTLAPIARVQLLDPKTGDESWIFDDSSASPTVGPDGDVYYGVLENPFPENNDRGWLLHFSSDLSETKTPGAFGWDETGAVVPASAVPGYAGTSTYLLMTKYNDYADIGTGNGQNRIAILDPDASETDPVTGVTVMNEVLTILGPTPNPPDPGVKEWCINSAAVDIPGRAVMANSEDGNLYRWDLTNNTLSQKVALTAGLGEAYTPTVIGVDGTVYAINDAILFAIGN
ncbi:MAG: hypothetical protein ABSF54_18780 [Bryobacteraceae bacterium]|jgi:hypothetical protein